MATLRGAEVGEIASLYFAPSGRLCRYPCGKALPFRRVIKSSCGYAAEAKPENSKHHTGKPEAFRKECGKAAVLRYGRVVMDKRNSVNEQPIVPFRRSCTCPPTRTHRGAWQRGVCRSAGPGFS